LKILECVNTEFSCLEITHLKDSLLEEFSQYPPIRVSFMNENLYFYYKHAQAFVDLQQILDDIVHSFMDEIMINSIFYENSKTIELLAYLPIIAFVIFGIFILSIIWGMRVSKQSENNKLWVGMSRETAHQLGTPLSSLKGWMEYLRTQNMNEEYLVEMEKDIDRLTVISERFSKIGSGPKMQTENIVKVIYKSISYLQPRLSRKIKLQVNVPQNAVMLAGINSQLVEWVLENLTRNAADAIETKDGHVKIDIFEHSKTIVIDIIDNGKGIPKNQWKQIFEPGYTTKLRGWGLGLPLCYRIIHDYHKGDIFVKQSTVGGGTTIRIILNK
jgi:signal transduction histidine kinase